MQRECKCMVCLPFDCFALRANGIGRIRVSGCGSDWNDRTGAALVRGQPLTDFIRGIIAHKVRSYEASFWTILVWALG